ncbi:DUF4129 domain-containing protein [Paenibacillaceae bacterium]|nr:DUF4129 domain-containing protein [Paenibacillaceae bacterium]
MGDSWKETGWAVGKGLVEVLLFFPLLLLLIVYLPPDPETGWIWLMTLPLLYGIGYAGSAWLRLQRFYLLLLLAITVGTGYACLLFGQLHVQAVFALFSGLAVYRGGKLTVASWRHRFPPAAYLAGTGFYFLGSAIFRSFEAFTDYLPLLTGLGLAALAITLYRFNSGNLSQETFSGDGKPAVAASVLRQNRIHIFLLLVFIIVLSLSRQIKELLQRIWEQIKQWINSLGSDATDLPPEEAPPQPEAPMFPEVEQGEPSLFWQWVERIAIVAAYAAVAVVLLFLLYKLGQKLPLLIRKVIHLLNRLFNRQGLAGDSAGYEDEVETLFELDSLAQKFKDRWRRMGRGYKEQRWEDLADNEQKIRFLYRKWLRQQMKQGYKPKSALTPREMMKDIALWHAKQTADPTELAEIYERVRYGKHTVQDDEVAGMLRLVDK